MATLVQSTQGMIDLYKGIDSNGRLLDVIEMLNNTAQYCLDDWAWMECNSFTRHTRSIRTGLPSVAWTSLYEGIPQSKSDKQQVDDTTGMVEALSQVDTRQLDLYGANAPLLRDQEARTFIEAMSQELMTALFYYDPNTNVKYPKGLGARFGALATSGAGNQIVDCGGSGSTNTSIWMVEWGYEGLTAIYPQGTVGGIKRENMGRVATTDGNGNRYYVEEEKISCHVGFSLGDWQRVVRLANLDITAVRNGSVKVYDFLRKGFYKLKNPTRTGLVQDQNAPGRLAIYCNRDVLECLDRLASNQGTTDNFTNLKYGEIQGQQVLQYRGIPIRYCDSLLNTEARVV